MPRVRPAVPALLLALAAALSVGSRAAALAIGASREAYGISAFGSFAVTLQAFVPPDDQTASLPSANLASGRLTAGRVSASLVSDVDGGSGTRFSSAEASVEDLVIGGTPAPLLTLTVGASGLVTADPFFDTLATVTFVDLAISVEGVSLTVPLDPAPNTVLYDEGGARSP
jgi:hypothetical protein